ncbi:cysteine dioxygenase [Pusillimonas noertemannii]|uniref:Putative metal-dependent enzyme (Double-stranded beta helix superfamily) n=1 Tax=Pusillimonas noertemannii TaxID=305977 RepID=A0A2U1CP50_9BURK|nr:cysteine dioxygenase [Pusillimonas noertemannii]NYT68258.1 cysteine dioxygenase [Pusillimonas noertemannii]PVY62727.1 putative metal-dependent enzyme (double-stranded beta helix superfamily) [Pusillimonas noertemannii]TFL10337.1 cysteine dioxygenase [Pusillimonas noertemannii]
MPDHTESLDPLRNFIAALTRLVASTSNEEVLLREGRKLLAALIATDEWLPDDCARAHPDHYQQYLLHCDPLERFSIVSFVWGPGQKTPVHDHTVWGMIGMLRGSETGQRYEQAPDGRLLPVGGVVALRPGDIELVSPGLGDIHQVANAFDDRVSISIHVYGANIGAVARNVWEPETGLSRRFVSGYSSKTVPNLWDRSSAVRGELQPPGSEPANAPGRRRADRP